MRKEGAMERYRNLEVWKLAGALALEICRDDDLAFGQRLDGRHG